MKFRLQDGSVVEVDSVDSDNFTKHFRVLKQLVDDGDFDPDGEVDLTIEPNIFNHIRKIINTVNLGHSINLTEISPSELAVVYEKMVYFLHLVQETHEKLLSAMNDSLVMISKFNEILNTKHLLDTIVNLLQSRKKLGIEAGDYVLNINKQFPEISRSVANEIRIAFIIDATCSMSQIIETQKNQAKNLYDGLQKSFGEHSKIVTIVIAYRDYCDGEGNQVFVSEICDDADKLRLELDKVDAIGGGDTAEAPELAFHKLYESNFYIKKEGVINIGLCIADAPPHDFLGNNHNDPVNLQKSKVFSEKNGDWATNLIKCIKEYNTTFYAVNVAPDTEHSTLSVFKEVELWMSVICTFGGTTVTHNISETMDYIIENIYMWAFQRKMLTTKLSAVSKDQLDQLVLNMADKTPSVLPPEIQCTLVTYRSLSFEDITSGDTSAGASEGSAPSISAKLERMVTDHSLFKHRFNTAASMPDYSYTAPHSVGVGLGMDDTSDDRRTYRSLRASMVESDSSPGAGPGVGLKRSFTSAVDTTHAASAPIPPPRPWKLQRHPTDAASWGRLESASQSISNS